MAMCNKTPDRLTKVMFCEGEANSPVGNKKKLRQIWRKEVGAPVSLHFTFHITPSAQHIR